MTQVRCAKCQKEMSVETTTPDGRVTCPECGHQMVLPHVPDAPGPRGLVPSPGVHAPSGHGITAGEEVRARGRGETPAPSPSRAFWIVAGGMAVVILVGLFVMVVLSLTGSS